MLGRSDYISNAERQEEILCQSELPVGNENWETYWQPYVEFEKANPKTGTVVDGVYVPVPNNEGREVKIPLPNGWAKLPEAELRERVQRLVKAAIDKDTDVQWAVHWNKKRDNLHVHILFSERTRCEDRKWDRDIYRAADGTIARFKPQRARNDDGTIKPPVHRKGESKGGFTAKEKRYTTKEWLYSMKTTKNTPKEGYKSPLAKVFASYGVEITPRRPWHIRQTHVGKRKNSPQIKERNEYIKFVNQKLDEIRAKGVLPKKLVELRKEILTHLYSGKKIEDGIKTMPIFIENKETNDNKLFVVTLKNYTEATGKETPWSGITPPVKSPSPKNPEIQPPTHKEARTGQTAKEAQDIANAFRSHKRNLDSSPERGSIPQKGDGAR